jgi:hypothetical protein
MDTGSNIYALIFHVVARGGQFAFVRAVATVVVMVMIAVDYTTPAHGVRSGVFRRMRIEFSTHS